MTGRVTTPRILVNAEPVDIKFPKRRKGGEASVMNDKRGNMRREISSPTGLWSESYDFFRLRFQTNRFAAMKVAFIIRRLHS